eukprot:6198623-Pleurochrysis_carterae.AAC.2
MRGGGLKYPALPRLHVCRAPIRKRKLPTKEPFDLSAARLAAAAVSDLRQELASTSAELQQLKSTCKQTAQSAVRAGVRRARGAPAEVAASHELVALKE